MKELLITLLFTVCSAALAEDRDIKKIFDDNGIEGTIVIRSLRSEQSFIHNEPRSNLRFTAASTFKIPNTLISLEEGVIAGKDSVLKWDGRNHEYASWNVDQTLESAFKVSCVWCFQELAHRIGAEKYNNYIKKLPYGRLSGPYGVTTFWLDGSLKISAVEQIDFLKAIYLRSLPFSDPTYETLREIMVVEETPNFTLRAKTGWAEKAHPQVGWYVGYVETKYDVWFFASNIKINNSSELALRQKITRKALQSKGLIEDA